MGKSQKLVTAVSLMCEQVERYMEIALMVRDDRITIDSRIDALFDAWIKNLDKLMSKLRGKRLEKVCRMVELRLIGEEGYEAIATNLVNVLQLMSRQLSQRDIVELQLAVGLWLETYKSFEKFIKEVEVLEKLLQ